MVAKTSSNEHTEGTFRHLFGGYYIQKNIHSYPCNLTMAPWRIKSYTIIWNIGLVWENDG